jgi:hypothetical protein
MTEQAAIREVVAVFDSREALENAIEDLQSTGFDRTQLSLLASRDTVEEQLQHPLTDVQDVADDPATPRSEPLERPDVGNVMGVAVGPPAAFAALATAGVIALAGGPLAGIAVGALAAGGGVGALGALLAKSFNDQVVADFQDQIERGGILLWVSLREPEQEAGAREILARHASGEVRTHEVAP